MNVALIPDRIAHWWGHLSPFKQGIWIFAVTVFVIELLFRYLAPKSPLYKRWTHLFESIGAVWTGVILALVYFLSVSVMNLGLRLFGKDPLDRKITAGSAWHPHEPNPLGPLAAARHQF